MATHEALAASPLAAVHAGEAMRPGIVAVSSRAAARTVAAVMAANEIHAVVTGAEPFAVTDLDVIAAAIAGRDGHWRGAPVPVVASDTSLAAVASAMVEAGTTHALVTVASSRLPAGVLSSFDIAAALAGREPRIARMIRPRAAVPGRSEARLGHVAAADAMHPGVITVPPSTPLRDLAGVLADRRMHAVGVVGLLHPPQHQERMVWSFATDAGVLRAAAAGDDDATAASIASGAPVVLDPVDSLEDAARAMVEHRTQHLIVADELGLPLGVVSTLDVLRVLAIGA